MPLEVAFASYHLGRLLSADAPDRPEMLGSACALFARLGCKVHLEIAKGILDEMVSV
jgi:hypothetical protein